MKMKNLLTLAIMAVVAFGLMFADQKAKKTEVKETKKDASGCCMDAKATKASDTKKSDAKGTAHATNAKHEKDKGMDCTDEQKCGEAHASTAKDGKDCCKEMTKAETDKAKETPAPKE